MAFEHDSMTSLLSFRMRSLRSRVSCRFPCILSREPSTLLRFKSVRQWSAGPRHKLTPHPRTYLLFGGPRTGAGW